MKHQIKPRKDRGFSLVEILVVIAVIGILAAISVTSIGAINDKANTAKSQRNAQTLCQLYGNARSVGAEFSTDDKAEILDQLIAGKSGPQLAGSSFKMSSLSDAEKAATLKYCSYDAGADAMLYDPSGGQLVDENTNPWENYEYYLLSDPEAQTDYDNLINDPSYEGYLEFRLIQVVYPDDPEIGTVWSIEYRNIQPQDID